MTSWVDQIGKTSRSTEIALWAAAGAVMLSAHAGAVAWALREPPMIIADDRPPPAIMIEFADVSEAVMTEETEISPDQKNADASDQAEEVKAPEEIPPEETVEPIEEVAEIEPIEEVDQIDQQVLAQLDKVEVPIPVAKPKPEVKKPEPKKKEAAKKPKQHQQQQAAAKAAVQTQTQVKQSNRNAARQTVSSSGLASISPAKWQSRLMAHLERRKKYPAGAKSRGERGVAYVRFSIDDNGNVLSASLAKSSGYLELDQEVLALVRRASPVPPPPVGAKRTITAPVRFNVR